MSDIVTNQIFANGETGITAAKMNGIIGQASVQTDFVASKPLASSVAPNDQVLLLTAAGPYARTNFSTITTSVSGSLVPAGVGQAGIMNSLSGNAGDYVGGDNACHSLAALIPTGAIWDFAGITAPTGFLMCDGSAVSRATYANLFNVLTVQTVANTVFGSPTVSVASTANMVVGMPISGLGIPAGTTISAIGPGTITLSANATATGTGVTIVAGSYGIGDGSTTFNVPDLRGRVAVGAGAGTGLTSRALAATGGEESHTLVLAELASHTHTMGNHTHTAPTHLHDLQNHSHGVASHTHDLQNHTHPCAQPSSVAAGYGGGFAIFQAVSSSTGGPNTNTTGASAPGTGGPSVNSTGGADRALTTTGPSANTTDAMTGVDTSHNTMQPFLVMNKIIKT